MDKIKVIVSVLLGAFATFAKQYGMIILLVGIIILFDWITGLVKAKVIGEKIESKKGTIGFFKKTAMLLALGFGIFMDFFMPFLLETSINLTLPFHLPFGMIVGVYIIVNEGISICENLYQCNPKIIPKWIAKLLKVASEKLDTPETEVKEHE